VFPEPAVACLVDPKKVARAAGGRDAACRSESREKGHALHFSNTASILWRAARQRRPEQMMPGKRVQFDDETWSALDLLARDRTMDFQELADEAFRDLLRKHNRPVDLKSALRQSAGERATVHSFPKKKRGKK
jgi:hypothetical protein